MNNYTYTYACRIITTTLYRRATQFFRKIYPSHFILERVAKGLILVMWERWVGDRTELQHIDPHSPVYHSLSFPISWAAQPGPGGPASARTWFSFQHLLSNQLTSCLHPGYIIVRCPLSSCERHKSHSIQPVHSQGYILILLDRMHLLFIQVHFLFWQLGWVGGQYTTIWI